ncbi:DUF1232 domain-containing protein [Gramella sp. AN32]|uniref:YkvA family protein n=1 Tax=Christiangramia antarctica TaxID=2058158 RepID=A0ABW5X2X1_9FLAO|nr:DUF1232 domain-containing protein [Gramella sp. AN32]MCM4157662.1 hypothetical protein [Gramella sp. AN32]
MGKIREWAAGLKKELVVAHLLSKHPGTPFSAKIILFGTLAYALSPIDLIPDFIPVLGLLDDLLIIPLGIYLAFKLIPPQIIAECRETARTFTWNKKKNIWAAVLILIFWISIFVFVYLKYFREKI